MVGYQIPTLSTKQATATTATLQLHYTYVNIGILTSVNVGKKTEKKTL